MGWHKLHNASNLAGLLWTQFFCLVFTEPGLEEKVIINNLLQILVFLFFLVGITFLAAS